MLITDEPHTLLLSQKYLKWQHIRIHKWAWNFTLKYLSSPCPVEPHDPLSPLEVTNFWTFQFKSIQHPTFLRFWKEVKCEAMPKSFLLRTAKPITFEGSSPYLTIQCCLGPQPRFPSFPAPLKSNR